MNLKVKVETQLNAVINYYSTDVEITANDAILNYSPCLKHKVYLVLSFAKSEKEPLMSNAIEYNKPSKSINGQFDKPWYGYSGSDLYSGLLNTEVVRHICLNKDFLSVTIPYIPESLKDCIETRMGAIQNLGTGENKVHVGVNVQVEIWGKFRLFLSSL